MQGSHLSWLSMKVFYVNDRPKKASTASVHFGNVIILLGDLANFCYQDESLRDAKYFNAVELRRIYAWLQEGRSESHPYNDYLAELLSPTLLPFKSENKRIRMRIFRTREDRMPSLLLKRWRYTVDLTEETSTPFDFEMRRLYTGEQAEDSKPIAPLIRFSQVTAHYARPRSRKQIEKYGIITTY